MGPTADDPVLAITEVSSDALDIPIKELPPLSGVIDLDALDRLVSPNVDRRPPGVTVTFEYAGLTVIVQSRGMVYATPITDEGDTEVNRRSFHL